MIGVIFEVLPHPERKQEYLEIAASIRPELETIKGFISVERFQSLSNPDKILSLSFYANEDALEEWRNLSGHRAAQSKGRGDIFQDYRIRVVSVTRDYGLNERDEAPVDSRAIHK
jgi:heme-degrading monooxygenase HmoA